MGTCVPIHASLHDVTIMYMYVHVHMYMCVHVHVHVYVVCLVIVCAHDAWVIRTQLVRKSMPLSPPSTAVELLWPSLPLT